MTQVVDIYFLLEMALCHAFPLHSTIPIKVSEPSPKVALNRGVIYFWFYRCMAVARFRWKHRVVCYYHVDGPMPRSLDEIFILFHVNVKSMGDEGPLWYPIGQWKRIKQNSPCTEPSRKKFSQHNSDPPRSILAKGI